MEAAAYACVMLLIPRAVAPAPRTWQFWTSHASPLDTHYGMNSAVATLLCQHLDYVLRCTYDEEDDPQAALRILLRRSHFEAHFAFAYVHGIIVSSWLADPSKCVMLPYLRAALLSRMLITWDWPNQESALPDFKPQKYVLISGIRKLSNTT